MYRPGEEVTIGVIVKTLDWSALPEGVPLEIAVVDPRFREIRSETLPVPRDGFRDWRFATFADSPTGVYQVELHIVRDGERRGLLGQTSVRVEEFLPDRMTIDARLSAPESPGWVSPADLRGRVALKTLVGTPAVGNRVKGTLRLSPAFPSFPRWRDWSFFDPMTAKQSFDETLAELTTNDAGEVEFPLGLERFARATYRLRFLAEGFEAEGNRSVANDAGTLVSPLPYLVAWKADGDLGFVRSGTPRTVQVVAVGPSLDPVPAADVTAELVEITYVSVLARQESGLMSYQSVKKETSRGKEPLALGATPATLSPPTDAPGRFFYVLRDAAGTELNRIAFEVVGEGNVAGRVERNAELKLALPKTDYAAGEEIEVAIVAPYSGAGLVTIERDRVYAARWFKTTGNSTVARIRVPDDLEGNGYVVVSFVRDLGSRDVFTSPLSSGAAPFSVSRTRRTHGLTLDVPEKVRPGSPLRIGWTAAAPTKLAVFAVDEGILQVARWKTPDPLVALLPEARARRHDVADPGPAAARVRDRPLARRAGRRPGLPPRGQPEPVQAEGPAARRVLVRDPRRPGGPGRGGVRGARPLQRHAPRPGRRRERRDRRRRRGAHARARPVRRAADGPLLRRARRRIRGDGHRHEHARGQRRVRDRRGGDPAAAWPRARRRRAGAAPDRGGPPGGREMARARDRASRRRRPDVPGQVSCDVRHGAGPGDGRDEHPTRRAVSDDDRDGGRPPRRPRRTAGRPRALRRAARRDGVGVDRPARPRAGSRALPRRVSARVHGAGREQGVPAARARQEWPIGTDPDQAAKRHERARAVLQSRQNAEGAFGIWTADSRTDPFLTAYATHYLLEARARGLAVPETTMRRALGYLASNLEPPSSLPGAPCRGLLRIPPRPERPGEDGRDARAPRHAARRGAGRVEGRPGGRAPRRDVPAAEPRGRGAPPAGRCRDRSGGSAGLRPLLRRADRARPRPLPARQALPGARAGARAGGDARRSPTRSRSSTRSRRAP